MMCTTTGSDFARSGRRWRCSPTTAGSFEMKLFLIQRRNRRSAKRRPTFYRCVSSPTAFPRDSGKLRTRKKGRKARDLQPFRGHCAVTPEPKLSRSALNQKLNHYGVWTERRRSVGLHFLFEMFNKKKN